MNKQDFQKLIKLDFLSETGSIVRHWERNKNQDTINDILSDLLYDDEIDWNNFIVVFPLRAGLQTALINGNLPIDHPANHVDIINKLKEIDPTFTWGSQTFLPACVLVKAGKVILPTNYFPNAKGDLSPGIKFGNANPYRSFDEKEIQEIEVFFSGIVQARINSFESTIIDPILGLIRDNQEYLTQKENLPQLAKLGFIYSNLWYIGRVGYGYNGKISAQGDCEENPKYKIEICNPINDEIENLIYDAWGMHVSNDYTNREEFFNKVNGIFTYTENELLHRKANKTFDEWVECLTNKEYKYSSIYPNRKAVANHLLCVIGNGYGFNGQTVFIEASGADQDLSIYGQWEAAKLREDFQVVVDRIMSSKLLEKGFDAYDKVVTEAAVRKAKKNAEYDKVIESLKKQAQSLRDSDPKKYKEITKLLELNESEEVYHPYYPISNYSIIDMIYKHGAEQSYITACIEICRETLAHQKEELAQKYHAGSNIKFARKFLKKYDPTYQKKSKNPVKKTFERKRMAFKNPVTEAKYQADVKTGKIKEPKTFDIFSFDNLDLRPLKKSEIKKGQIVYWKYKGITYKCKLIADENGKIVHDLCVKYRDTVSPHLYITAADKKYPVPGVMIPFRSAKVEVE